MNGPVRPGGNGPRWKVADLLLLVLTAGLASAACRYFWRPPPHPNGRLHLVVNLAVLSTASLGAFFARPAWRRPCQGYALFGWCNLAFVLWDGFRLMMPGDGPRLVEGSQMGVVFGTLCGLAAAWFLEPPRPGDGTSPPP